MKALAQFESFLEGLVEGSLRRLFRGRLEPVDLARRLARVMDDHKRITWQRPLVPNRYDITLAPPDFGDVQGFVESLQRELARFAAERAAECGYAMLAAPDVKIAPDASLPPTSFRVQAALVDSPPLNGTPASGAGDAADSADDVAQTRAMRPLEMPVGPVSLDPLYLVGDLDGRRVTWPISHPRVTVGRGLDNDVVLDDPSVSRHHAEITREGGRIEVRDLGSTNGTWVNAARVAAAAVHPGDELAFGAVHLDVARRPAE